MPHRLLAGACLVLVSGALQASAASSSPTLTRAPGEYAGRWPSTAVPSCKPPTRRPGRYAGEWQFVPSGSGEVSGEFGRLSWTGAVLEYDVAAGFVVDLCASTRGGGMEFSISDTAVGPRDGRIDLDDPIAMVGYGVVRSVPSSITSGL